MMFGDDKTVVNTPSMPHGKLHKRHNALAYHQTRAGIAAGIIRIHPISEASNLPISSASTGITHLFGRHYGLFYSDQVI